VFFSSSISPITSDGAHLAGQVAREQVDVVGQVLPHPADLDGHSRRLAELALGADLTGDAGDLGGEAVQLVHHGVDGVLQLQHLAAHVRGDLLAQVAVGHRPDDALHLARRAHERLDQAVDRLDAALPALRPAAEHDALAQLPLAADDHRDPG